MRSAAALALLPVMGAQGIRILQGNDDGWAEAQARVFHEELKAGGHDVVLSMPAENQSGTGSNDEEPEAREEPCQYDSCPANSGPTGTNSTDTRLNWVNSYPVTALKYGLDTFGPDEWDGQAPELVVSGPNTGSNLVVQVPFSGTVGVACHAVDTAKIPAIAFSVMNGYEGTYDQVPVPEKALLYGALAAQFTERIIEAGVPYLPEGVWLNVNFPAKTGNCTSPGAFQYVLSRINPGIISEPDVETCGTDQLPVESDVIFADGCYASVSVGDASDKTTMNDTAKQQEVLDKISDILVCLPE